MFTGKMHAAFWLLKSRTQRGDLTGGMMRTSRAGPTVCRPDFCEGSLQVIQ